MLRFVLVLDEASPRLVVYKQRTTPNGTTITTRSSLLVIFLIPSYQLAPLSKWLDTYLQQL
jgi:hypothetical protein